ncbi:hypothetical protein QQF64_013048 [Cirrhinus molitorella]|uniref:Uncharacterized protein n=1 Tax=Cirrhinus molitorella TaxID=172907 RepID=A0ABR3LQ19_9TELE
MFRFTFIHQRRTQGTKHFLLVFLGTGSEGALILVKADLVNRINKCFGLTQFQEGNQPLIKRPKSIRENFKEFKAKVE